MSRIRTAFGLWVALVVVACRGTTPAGAEERAPTLDTPREPGSAGGAPARDSVQPHSRGDARPTALGPLAAHFRGPAAEAASHVILLLHGFGDRGDGLVLIAQELAASSRGLAVVALEGLLAHPQGGRMWWPIDMLRIQRARADGLWPDLERERAPGVDAAREAVVAALEELHVRGVPRERVTLAGFSQGAMLSVDVGLAHPELLSAVVALSGAVIDRTEWEQRGPNGVRFTVVHGRRDSVLPFARGEALRDLLRRVDPAVTWVPFDGPHTISAEGRAALLGAVPTL